MTGRAVLVWFRNDLRVTDHPALLEASERGSPVIPIYIRPSEEEGDWPKGSAGRWWLHHSLIALDRELRQLNSKLILRKGKAAEVLQNLLIETHAEALYWNRRYEPTQVAQDSLLKSEFRSQRVEVQSYNGSLLFEPWDILTRHEKPYQVFTPFWKACVAQPEPPMPLPPPRSLLSPETWPVSLSVDSLQLLPCHAPPSPFQNHWTPGSEGALDRLDRFIEEALKTYSDDRDKLDIAGTSCLSPHLHFGEISARQVMHAVLSYVDPQSKNGAHSAWSFLRQLGWREFSYHLLFHFPFTADQPMNPVYTTFPWQENPALLMAWQKGQTGYPLVDAGMRQLQQTGWIPNRMRMIVASFLVKDLLIPWQQGAQWFWETLVDADLANNTMGWQWITGCGADAAPYYHIFNPVRQGERFDPQGKYVKLWVPELQKVPEEWIHQPWAASPLVLSDAGVTLGETYPEPIVDHAYARQRAMELYEDIKNQSKVN